MKQWPDLTDVLGEIPWATVGGVATRHYAPERATIDLDVLVRRSDADTVHTRLTQGGFQHTGKLAFGSSGWKAPDGTDVDVLESDEPWVESALEQSQNNRDLQGLPVLLFPYFILMKLRSGRLLDLGDLGRMLGLASETDLDAVRKVIAQYEPGALEDVESIIMLGRLEMHPDDGSE